MKSSLIRGMYFYGSLILAILIIIAPTLVTGRFQFEGIAIGSAYVGEYVMRIISLIIGLFIIYDTLKTYYKYK